MSGTQIMALAHGEITERKEYQVADEAQLLNKLKATGSKVGLLINSGRTKVDFKRFTY